jgi:hypothetical protein
MARKAPQRRVEAHESYLFRIETLQSHYSFGSGAGLQRTAHREHLHPEIEAVCLAPSKLAGRETRFTIIGDRQMEQDLWMQEPASNSESGIGTLTMRGSQSTYLGSLPYDAAWGIQPLIFNGDLRFIYLHGAAMSRGTARISWMAFYTEFDPNEV